MFHFVLEVLEIFCPLQQRNLSSCGNDAEGRRCAHNTEAVRYLNRTWLSLPFSEAAGLLSKWYLDICSNHTEGVEGLLENENRKGVIISGNRTYSSHSSDRVIFRRICLDF